MPKRAAISSSTIRIVGGVCFAVDSFRSFMHPSRGGQSALGIRRLRTRIYGEPRIPHPKSRVVQSLGHPKAYNKSGARVNRSSRLLAHRAFALNETANFVHPALYNGKPQTRAAGARGEERLEDQIGRAHV